MSLFGAYYQWIPEGDPNDVGFREFNGDRRGIFPVIDFTPKGIIHVGAHDMWEAHHYAKACGADVVWFEANPASYEKWKHIPQSYGQQIYNRAAWNKNGEVSLYSDWDQSHINAQGAIKVPAVRVDDFMELNVAGWYDYDFLNIDAEGAEVEVLEGCRDILPQIQWVHIEVDPDVTGPVIDQMLLEHDLIQRYQTTVFTKGDRKYCDRLYGKL